MKTNIGNDNGLIANGIRRHGGIHIFDDNQAKYIDPNVEITASTYDTIDTIVYDRTNIATEFTTLNGAESSTGELVATGMDGYGIAGIGTGVQDVKATPDMTDYDVPSGVVTESSKDSTDHGWKAFDNTNKSWFSLWNETANEWLGYEFPNELVIGKYGIRAGAEVDNAPRKFKLLGSDTGSFSGEEIILDEQVRQTFSVDETKEYLIPNMAKFKYYRVHFNTLNGGGQFEVREIYLYEVKEPLNDTVTLIDNVESDFILQNISTGSTVDTLNTTVPIQDGDNLVIVKDDDSIHEIIASDVTETTMSETWTAPTSHNEDVIKFFNGSNPMTLRVYGSTENDTDYIFVYDEIGTRLAKLSGTFDNTYTINGTICSVRYTSDESTNDGPANATASWSGSSIDTSAITQGEIPSRVFAQPKVAFDVGSGFVESVLDSNTPVYRNNFENLVPEMTSNNQPSGLCTTSSTWEELASEWAWNIWDRKPENWASDSGNSTEWAQYEFETNKTVLEYQIDSQHTDGDYITKWKLLGSNTGSFTGEETVLDIQENQTFIEGIFNVYPITSPGSFKVYRLFIQNWTSNIAYINEMRLMGDVPSIATHNTYASQEVSTMTMGSKIILRNIGDKMTVFTDTLKNCHY